MSNPIRMRAVEGLKAGDSFSYTRTFTREDTENFGDLTRDFNPVHYEARWARAKGFRGLICHGLLVGSMICEFGGQVGWLATGMKFKFLKPVYFGDTVQCNLTITKIEGNGRAEAEAFFTNQEGAGGSKKMIRSTNYPTKGIRPFVTLTDKTRLRYSFFD